MLQALGGEVHLRSAKKRRRVPAKDFFTGMMATTRADDEIDRSRLVSGRGTSAARSVKWRAVTAILPLLPAPRWRRQTGVRLAVGGVADMPAARDLPRPRWQRA